MALALARHVRAERVGEREATPRTATPPSAPGATPASPSISAVNDGALTWLELPLARERGLPRRALVLYPTGGAPGQTYPGLLLFHGRGETSSEQVGIHAWRTRYGLERSFARLGHPPVELDPDERAFIAPEHLARLNATLLEQPFSGLVVICPYTPNSRRQKKSERVLDRYSEWIEHTLLPAAQRHAPLDAARGIGVDGCSLGGYVAAEVFVRKPHLFRSFGVVQPAVGEYRVPRYARHLARALARESLRAIHLQTSTRDPYRGAVKALARHLKRQGAQFTLDVLPGPHDQRWLRASGTLAMLAWHDSVLT
jgi:enterochelin esterase-like enzyme